MSQQSRITANHFKATATSIHHHCNHGLSLMSLSRMVSLHVTTSSPASSHVSMARCWSLEETEASKSHPWDERLIITTQIPDENTYRSRGREMIGVCAGVGWGVLKVHDSQLNPAGGYQCCRCLHQLDANHSSQILQTPPTWGQETASVLHTNKLQTKPAALHGIPHRLWEGWASGGERRERVREQPRGGER